MGTSTPPLVYIITLNWNRCNDTLAFLESCSRLVYPNVRILVVDNASTDGSGSAIAAQFPCVEQLSNARNQGFAAGANRGIRHALAHGADFMFLANNDTFMAVDTLTLLMDAALTADADLAAPAIYYADTPDRVWSIGGWRRHPTLEIAACQRWQHGVSREPEPFRVDFITGCGMLIRRRCLETVGLFDEWFFMYYEDSDYCLRARAAGAVVIVVPRARMWHKVATSHGGSDSPGERYYMALSSVQFFKKHIRGWPWAVVIPYRAASTGRTLLRLLTRGRHAAAGAYLRGLWDGVRS
jgi:GT2 family glycosyltransferase